MFKHVLRNAINPLLTSFGYAFSSLLGTAGRECDELSARPVDFRCIDA